MDLMEAPDPMLVPSDALAVLNLMKSRAELLMQAQAKLSMKAQAGFLMMLPADLMNVILIKARPVQFVMCEI